MSTSPGPRGGSGNRENLVKIMPYWGAKAVFEFGFGSFYQNFSEETSKITDLVKIKELEGVVRSFEEIL